MSEPMRFFEWDIANDACIEYARSGECCECGACCTALIMLRIQAHGFGKSNPIEGWHSANGELSPNTDTAVSIEVRVGEHRRFFNDIRIDPQEQQRCSNLTGDNRCSTHIGKMLLHRAWPMSPRHVTPFPECTYTFTEIGHWKISELAEVADV